MVDVFRLVCICLIGAVRNRIRGCQQLHFPQSVRMDGRVLGSDQRPADRGTLGIFGLSLGLKETVYGWFCGGSL